MGNAVITPLSSTPKPDLQQPQADCPAPEADCPAPEADCPAPEADCPAPCPSPESLFAENPCYLWHHGYHGIDSIVLYETIADAYAAAQKQVALLKTTPNYWHKTHDEILSDIDTNSFTHNHVFPEQMGQPDAKDRLWSVYQTAGLQVYLGLGIYLPADQEAHSCPEGYNIIDSKTEDPEMPPLFRCPVDTHTDIIIPLDDEDIMPPLIPYDEAYPMPAIVPA
jgi:hypothetical protein